MRKKSKKKIEVPVNDPPFPTNDYFRSEKPALWLYMRISNGTIYKIAAERIAEMKANREMNFPTGIEESVKREVKSKEIKEMMHFPQALISWMEKHLQWTDIMLFAMQAYSSKIIDPAEEWATCPKGVLFEGDEL